MIMLVHERINTTGSLCEHATKPIAFTYTLLTVLLYVLLPALLVLAALLFAPVNELACEFA